MRATERKIIVIVEHRYPDGHFPPWRQVCRGATRQQRARRSSRLGYDFETLHPGGTSMFRRQLGSAATVLLLASLAPAQGPAAPLQTIPVRPVMTTPFPGNT